MAVNVLSFKVVLIIRFLLFYIYEIVVSAIRIAWDVVTVDSLSKPGIFKLPLSARTDSEIAIVANLITFSPGTMVIGIDKDRKFMLIHSMFLEDEQQAVDDIKTNLEKRVLEVLR